jgi:Tfp pilus assembly protein PilF
MARVYQLPEEDREYMLKLAVEHYSENRLGQAEKVLRGLLAAEPDDARAWQLLGSCLAVQGFRVAAEQVYKRALELDPKDAYALVALAEIALDALRWEDAKPLFERLFALDPDGTHPAANRGRRILAAAKERLGGG